jgi:hypothetical protein
MIGSAVAAGATRPNIGAASTAPNPASAMVGTSGISGERSPTMASARARPARTCSRIDGTVANVICT